MASSAGADLGSAMHQGNHPWALRFRRVQQPNCRTAASICPATKANRTAYFLASELLGQPVRPGESRMQP